MSLESFSQPNTPETKTTTETMQELMAQVIAEADAYEIKPEDKNEKGELLVSPEGPVSNLGKQSELWWKMARTESFKKFFGDWQNDPENSSKIIDEKGEPLPMYRGVSKELTIEQFYDNDFYSKGVKKGDNKKFFGLGRGIYTTPKPEVAANFASLSALAYGGKLNIFVMFANVRKPQFKPDHSLKASMEKLVNNKLLLIPRKLFDNIPEVRFTDYDSVYWDYENRFDDQKLPPVKGLYEVLLKDTEQLLIIPNVSKKTNNFHGN